MSTPDADPGSAVGDLTSLGEGQVLLPGFVTRRPDGLWVDVAALDSPGILLHFVERVFSAGARFVGLDHALLRNLLFDYATADIAALLERLEKASHTTEMLIAADIVPFPPQRQALYRGIKVLGDGEGVEYLFEPVTLDVEQQVPRFDLDAAVDASGARPLLGYDTQTIAEPAQLDFDEFIAALWSKGVRYGIDAATVRAAIASQKTERLTIAQARPARSGTDASISEQTDALHRDDSPRILPDGRMDLRHFRNRFPQVAKGTRLFKKVPRVPGLSGWNVFGGELAPGAVKDFDISTLAGLGTRIERDAAGNEFVVAAMDGFLDIDAKSNQLSISDKIIHREGVSARSTGNLVLSGKEYEEHGEVQEKRVVEGHDMTFLADVFGSVISDGGQVLFRQNISGGNAKSPGGGIVVEGAASNATLEARGGSIDVAQALGCVVIGQSVHIVRAVNCTIVAEEVVIETAEGCAIAGRAMTIGEARPRREEGCAITVLLPDVAQYARDIAVIATESEQAAAEIVARREALAILAEQPDLKSFLTLQAKINSGSVILKPEQKAGWQQLVSRVAPAMREYAAIAGKVKSLQDAIDSAPGRIQALQDERAARMRLAHCRIDTAGPETLVRTRNISASAPPLEILPVKELRAKLREPGVAADRLFDGEGTFTWPPDQANSSEQQDQANPLDQ